MPLRGSIGGVMERAESKLQQEKKAVGVLELFEQMEQQEAMRATPPRGMRKCQQRPNK